MADDVEDVDDSQFALSAKEEAAERAAEVKKDRQRQRRGVVLDTILRKIHRCGNSNQLTREEWAFLERTSKELADELGKHPTEWDPPAEEG